MSILAGASLLSGLTGIGAIAVAPAAGAATVTPACGSTVTTSIKLGGNIGPCTKDGLIVVADNVTINLNGHTISGDGDYQNGAQAGIHITGHSGVRIIGPGVIHLFNAAVAMENSSNNTVSKVTAILNKGCNVDSFPAPQVCADNNMGDGILLVSSNKNQITNNTVTSNASQNVAAGGISMVFGSSQNVVSGNIVTDNNNTGIRVESGAGLGNLISKNSSKRNNGNGVSLSFGAAGNQVISNDIEDNAFTGVGVSFDGNNSEIANNIIKGNGGTGVSLGSGNNRVEFNTVSNNGGSGVSIGGGSVFIQDDGSVGDFVRRHNVVQHNTVNDNGRNGIIVVCAKDFVATAPSLANKCLITTTYLDSNSKPISVALSNHIMFNTATGNGGTSAGILTRDGSGNPTGRFDLLDQNENPPCDHDAWSGNVATTGFPACTLM